MTRRSWWVAAALAATAAMAVGAVELPRKSAALEIGINGGKPLVLASYRGKAVLLAFILTTCPHCQYTTGLLKQFQAEYGGRGLQVVEAAIDSDAEAQVPGFIQHFQPNFPVGFTSYDTAAAYLQHNPALIMHVPSLVFIDRLGTIRAEYEGDARIFSEDKQEQNLRAEIEKLLGGGRKPPAKTAAK